MVACLLNVLVIVIYSLSDGPFVFMPCFARLTHSAQFTIPHVNCLCILDINVAYT